MKKYRKMEEDLNKEFNDFKENLNEIQKQSKNFISINEKRLENFNKLDEIIEKFEQLKVSVDKGIKDLKFEQPGIKLMLKTFYEELLNRENDLKLAKEIIDNGE